ncbi:hypothetical protein KBT16_15505 [Nostoc sp. CCCryo 231-06]|nr:hypothetical protein [Nostoc sp. CCCryo 231-06]
MKNIVIFLTITSIAITGTSCSNSNKTQVSQAVVSQVENSDPVAQFKTLIEEKQTYINKGAGILKSSEGWTRMSAKVADIKYDVNKTDSLVSPYTGITTLDVLLTSEKFTTESEARGTAISNAKGSSEPFPLKCRETYAYQESKWVVKQQEYFVGFPGEEKWVPFSGDRDGLSIGCGFVKK